VAQLRFKAPLSGWAARLLAALLCLAVAMPLAATARAQVTGPSLTVGSIDSGNFPSVTVNLAATGSNGLPLVGLAADNFTVTEDGQAVGPGSLALASDTSAQLSLVLAFDISMSTDNLARIQAAAVDFVAGLGPNDKVALVSFYEQVEEVQSFTNDKGLLTSAINNLTAGGNGTNFNEAVDKAITQLAALPPGRKAVIVFTNSGDTSATLSPEPILAQAQAAGVRVYPMALGPNVNAEVMNNWARFTGGQAYILTGAAEVPANLLTLGVLMRQSYKLTFKSGLKADNKPHAIIVNLSYQGQTAQGQGEFTAVPGVVTVVGPGITDGQTVRGRVFLIADVTAPAPVAAVAFILDGQALVTLTAPPYRYDWDSTTAAPGVHTLAVRASDEAGNVGESSLSVNVVLPPVAVVTATPAAAESTAAAAAAAQPSQLQTFGQNALSVLGRVATGAALLAAMLVALVLALRNLRGQRQVQAKSCEVEIINQGNVRSRYELRAEDPAGKLKFEFMLNDTDLATRAGEPVTSRALMVPGTPAPGTNGKPAGAVARVKDGLGKAEQVEQKALRTVNTGNLISNWIVNISYILPGSAGRSLRDSTAGMRSAQYNVRNTVDAPGRYRRMVSAAAPPDLSGANPNTALGTNTVTVPWPKEGVNPPPRADAKGGVSTSSATVAAAPTRAARSGWSLTPPIDAGGSLTVQLLVRPAGSPKSQHYGFQVLSRSVDGAEDAPVVDHGSVALRAAPVVRRVLGWVLFALSALLLAVLAWYVLSALGVIG
jgi:VWFA-related protein